MHILFCGDVVGRSGREALSHYLPLLKRTFSLDYIIVNAENSAHGFGITEKICKDLYAFGVDVITTGNHIWDQKETISYIQKDPHLLRPLNFLSHTPGNGFLHLKSPNHQGLLVINAMGRLFMDSLEDPFYALDCLLEKFKLGVNVSGIFVDFHAEATSEKMAMAHHLDGRVSAVIGTHTHIPTADAHILPKGTSYQTDAGMTGDYLSVVGMDAQIATRRFTKKFSKERLSAAQGEATLCGTLIKIDDKTGQTVDIQPIRLGGILKPTHSQL